MSSTEPTLSAEHATWDTFLPTLREALERETDGCEDTESVDLTSVYVLGSLATEEGRPEESDVDITIGVSNSYPNAVYEAVISRVEENESRLCAALGLPVTGIHVVDVTEPDRAAHRAMELQWQGNELAREYGKSTSPLRIYDAVHREFLNNARNAKPV